MSSLELIIIFLALLSVHVPSNRNSVEVERKKERGRKEGKKERGGERETRAVEFHCPGLKILVGSMDLQLHKRCLKDISVMRRKSPNQIHKYSSVGRACFPG